jgi:hypothetical protein
MSRKVFTAGEVLAAADVNSFLMDQTVMSFAGTAARGSAISSPVEGMVAYLEDTNLYTGYNGTAWTSLGSLSGSGLVHIATSTFSAQTAIQVNSCFSAEFDNYKVIFTNLVIASGDPLMSYQMVNGSTPFTGANYNSQILGAQGTSVFGNNVTNQTSGRVGGVGPGANYLSLEVSAPFLAANTKTNSFDNYFGNNIELQFSRVATSTSYDGIRFSIASSTMTGNIRIYGYRNA